MYTNIAKNPLRTFLGLNRKKNKNIKASPKKRSSYKKKSVAQEQASKWSSEAGNEQVSGASKWVHERAIPVLMKGWIVMQYRD